MALTPLPGDGEQLRLYAGSGAVSVTRCALHEAIWEILGCRLQLHPMGQKRLGQEGCGWSQLAAHSGGELWSDCRQLSLVAMQRHGNALPGYCII